MEENLLHIKNDVVSLVMDAESLTELNQIYIEFLGRSGILTKELKKLKSVPEEKRPEVGKLANEIKNTIETVISDKKKSLKINKHAERVEKLDITKPGIKPAKGSLHLVTQAIKEISQVFESIGFTRVRYPEVEWDWYAFEALNFPEDHPARDDWETFFIDEKPSEKYGPMILTPHTSSGQVREMINVAKSTHKGQSPSIRMLNLAKCYRRQSDVSHTEMFHQFEGLVVDENITIGHLKGVLEYFVKSFFGSERTSRIRPYQFQFTEPSFEVDISCGICKGKGCKLCKEGWLELGGAGMVHPNVLKAGGIDPEKYTGFAFGWGVERVLMMKEGMNLPDLRLIYSNRIEFLKQF